MTLRLAIVGHSVLHERQESLSKCLASNDWEVLGCGPSSWSDEVYAPFSDHSYSRALFPVTGHSIFDIQFPGLGETLDKFDPQLVYVQQEPWSNLALQASRWCRANRVPLCVFSWENRSDMGLGAEAVEKEVLEGAAGVVAGNSMAKARMLSRGLPEKTPVLISPQTGINTNRFRPMPEVAKAADVIYHGRLVREKGLAFIEEACLELGLSLLIVGGRGNYTPRYYQRLIPWSTYEALPALINSAKVSATCSWAYKGYFEQWPSAAPDSAACGLQTVITNHGAMVEHYATAPFHKALEADQASITRTISRALKFPLDGGREWVQKNMSVEAIAAKVEMFLEGLCA